MEPKAILGIAALVLFVGLTVWEFRQAARLEALLGQKVDWLRAASAFKLRMIDERRCEYPEAWHRAARMLQAMSLVRVLAALFAFSLLTSLFF